MTHERTTPDVPGRRFLLVYPYIPDTYWSYRHALRFVGKKALMPPLGLLTVAAMIPGHDSTRLVDCNVEELTDDDLDWADYVLLSAMIVQGESMREVIDRSRRRGKPVVAGGPYPTSCHEDIDGVDHFVLDEAELTFPQFLADLDRGTAKTLYRAEGRARLEEAPVPRFELARMELYDTLPVQFSRGCPFDCEFCDIVSLFGHYPRTKPPQHFIAELDHAHRAGFRGGVFVVDDNFIGNRRNVLMLLRALIAWQQDHGFPFRFSTEASVDLGDRDELLELMRRAGFTMVFVGLETPNEASLASAGKAQNLRGNVRSAVRRIQRAGIEVTAGFIIGFDTDPPDIFERQLDFIRELGVPTAMVGLLMALPNTRLWSRLEREGRLLGRGTGNNTHQGELNFRTRLPESFLRRGYQWLLAELYRPRDYFARCLTLLEHLPARRTHAEAGQRQLRADEEAEKGRRSLRRASRGTSHRAPHRGFHRARHRAQTGPRRSFHPIRRREIAAFARSLVRQGLSWYGGWYAWYLVRALLRRPRLAVAIVTHAVQGHHYFTITRRSVGRRARRLPGRRRKAVSRAAGARAGGWSLRDGDAPSVASVLK